MTGIVEKLHPDVAPSHLSMVGRYVLTPGVMALLERVIAGAGGEIQLTDAIAAVLKSEGAFGYEFEGRRFDCGSKLGYLEANVMFALKHAEIGREFSTFLAGLDAKAPR
jgi:UTP--glucose-1-phosphate uridylyltransferase